MRPLPALILVLAACNGDGGDDGSTTAPAGCDSVVTDALTQVPTDQWPAGTPDAIDNYLGVAGRWEAVNSCGDPTGVKITIQSEESLQLVLDPWADGSNCGCLSDPSFEADSAYPVVALHDNFQFFVETFDDPGVQGKTVSGAGALFGSGAPLKFRGCGTQNIDPISGSEYDLLTTVIRVESSGAITGSIVLVDEDGTAGTQVCDLTNWTFVE